MNRGSGQSRLPEGKSMTEMDKRTTKGNKTTVAKACSFGRESKKEGRKGIFERKNKE